MRNQPFSYSHHEKLKSRKLLNGIFATGKSVSFYPIKVIYQRVDTQLDNLLQVGVGVSSRHFKKAVDRNRIKRLLRESYRTQKQLLNFTEAAPTQKVLFFLYVGKELPEAALIQTKMAVALQKISETFK
ncbi:MAG: ribonuclease P protein component [Bacteroidetes bacterium]|nr:ribonuclease P protein component [Bacteroidota bacterium]